MHLVQLLHAKLLHGSPSRPLSMLLDLPAWSRPAMSSLPSLCGACPCFCAFCHGGHLPRRHSPPLRHHHGCPNSPSCRGGGLGSARPCPQGPGINSRPATNALLHRLKNGLTAQRKDQVIRRRYGRLTTLSSIYFDCIKSRYKRQDWKQSVQFKTVRLASTLRSLNDNFEGRRHCQMYVTSHQAGDTEF